MRAALVGAAAAAAAAAVANGVTGFACTVPPTRCRRRPASSYAQLRRNMALKQMNDRTPSRRCLIAGAGKLPLVKTKRQTPPFGWNRIGGGFSCSVRYAV